jgi:hypothetical protein
MVQSIDNERGRDMQVKHFESGGFVIHKVAVPESALTFSAWYDERGQLLDVEAFTKGGKPYAPFTVSRAKGPVGQSLKLIGFQHAKA